MRIRKRLIAVLRVEVQPSIDSLMKLPKLLGDRLVDFPILSFAVAAFFGYAMVDVKVACLSVAQHRQNLAIDAKSRSQLIQAPAGAEIRYKLFGHRDGRDQDKRLVP